MNKYKCKDCGEEMIINSGAKTLSIPHCKAPELSTVICESARLNPEKPVAIGKPESQKPQASTNQVTNVGPSKLDVPAGGIKPLPRNKE